MGADIVGRGVQSVEVGGRILSTMVQAGPPLMPRDIAAGAKVTPAQAHAYLVSSRRIGSVEQEPGSVRYQPGPFALHLGLARMRGSNALRTAWAKAHPAAGPTVREAAARVRASETAPHEAPNGSAAAVGGWARGPSRPGVRGGHPLAVTPNRAGAGGRSPPGTTPRRRRRTNRPGPPPPSAEAAGGRHTTRHTTREDTP